MKLAFLLAAIAASLTFGSVAKADTVDYTFTGASAFAGANFTYVSTTGFLPLSFTMYTPTTETGGVTSFAFTPNSPGVENLFVLSSNPTFQTSVTGLDPTVAGTEHLFSSVNGVLEGTLVISVPEINAQNAVTPLALLAGVILVIRGRRKVSAF